MSASSHDSLEPNMTPILDMVFQLITFFMLVMNFKAASLDLSLQLPILGSARPHDTNGEESVLVLNIDDEGRFKQYGVVKDLRTAIAEESRTEINKLKATKPNFKTGDELPTMVVVRADRSVPFKQLNSVLKVCQEFGYRNFSLNAMNKSAE